MFWVERTQGSRQFCSFHLCFPRSCFFLTSHVYNILYEDRWGKGLRREETNKHVFGEMGRPFSWQLHWTAVWWHEYVCSESASIRTVQHSEGCTETFYSVVVSLYQETAQQTSAHLSTSVESTTDCWSTFLYVCIYVGSRKRRRSQCLPRIKWGVSPNCQQNTYFHNWMSLFICMDYITTFKSLLTASST